MKNKICHISSVHPATDNRIFYKECVSLTKAGFEVNLIARHPVEEVRNGVKIIPFSPHKNRIARILFSPWKLFFKTLKTKAKWIHFHDPELIFIGLVFLLFGKKVVYDAHEDVPKQILYKEWLKPAVLRKIVSSVFKITELFASFFFTKIITVTEDIAKKFPAHKTIIVKNYPILELTRNAISPNISTDKKIIVYAGGLTRVRGIKELIQSIEYLEECELCLLGKFSENNYFEECRTLDGWKKVNYVGFKPMEEVFGYLQIADVGVCLLYPIKNYLTSLPIKAFEYLAFGLPVLLSDFDYWKKIFGEYAWFSNPHDPKKIAEKITFLLSADAEIKQKTMKGKKAVQAKLCWEREAEKLVSVYR